MKTVFVPLFAALLLEPTVAASPTVPPPTGQFVTISTTGAWVVTTSGITNDSNSFTTSPAGGSGLLSGSTVAESNIGQDNAHGTAVLQGLHVSGPACSGLTYANKTFVHTYTHPSGGSATLNLTAAPQPGAISKTGTATGATLGNVRLTFPNLGGSGVSQVQAISQTNETGVRTIGPFSATRSGSGLTNFDLVIWTTATSAGSINAPGDSIYLSASARAHGTVVLQ